VINRTLDLFVVDTTGLDGTRRCWWTVCDRAGFATSRSYDGRSMKSQMKVADRSGARLALLIGPMEHGAGQVTIRDLRSENFEQAQQTSLLRP